MHDLFRFVGLPRRPSLLSCLAFLNPSVIQSWTTSVGDVLSRTAEEDLRLLLRKSASTFGEVKPLRGPKQREQASLRVRPSEGSRAHPQHLKAASDLGPG